MERKDSYLAAETTWIAKKVNVIAGAMGEIMIRGGKVLILYNTIRKVSSD
jgi:hypothetical protein